MSIRDQEFDREYLSRSMKVKRAERGWTQADLARASGVDLNTIARAEACKNIPNFTTMCALADAFGCRTDDFWPRRSACEQRRRVS